MHVVVCYDIVGDRRRAKIWKRMKGFLPRVQKSVFEGELDEGRIVELREMIAGLVDAEEDTVRIYRVCARCVPATEIIGTGRYIGDEDEDEIV